MKPFISLKVVRLSFDPGAILRAEEKAARRILMRMGAFIRRSARQSIRRPRRKPQTQWNRHDWAYFKKTGKKPAMASRPGGPPRSPRGKLKNTIRFQYDPDDQSVVIGPVQEGTADVPGTIEQGGRIRVGRMHGKDMAARPYMGPALMKELPKLAPMWANSIR